MFQVSGLYNMSFYAEPFGLIGIGGIFAAYIGGGRRGTIYWFSSGGRGKGENTFSKLSHARGRYEATGLSLDPEHLVVPGGSRHLRLMQSFLGLLLLACTEKAQ